MRVKCNIIFIAAISWGTWFLRGHKNFFSFLFLFFQMEIDILNLIKVSKEYQCESNEYLSTVCSRVIDFSSSYGIVNFNKPCNRNNAKNFSPKFLLSVI